MSTPAAGPPHRAASLLSAGRVWRAMIALALIPSAWLCWQGRRMDQLGNFHDDANYYVCAKSLAAGQGYRIESLPNRDFQTKYPPLWPAVLSLAWRVNPEFPANLGIAAALLWVMIPAATVMAYRLLRACGFSDAGAAIPAIWFALNPTTVLLGTLLMSELLFVALLLGALTLAERAPRSSHPARLALLAGAAGGLAALARTAGVPLLLTTPVVYAWRRRWKEAGLFAAGMIPFVGGWQLWCAARRTPYTEFADVWYTSYTAQFATGGTMEILPSVILQNLIHLISGVGQLFLFSPQATLPTLGLAVVVLIFTVAGVQRLAGSLPHYAAFAATAALQLLIANYSPDTRFLIPMAVLLGAAFFDQMGRSLEAVARMWGSGSVADRGTGLLLGTLLLLLGALQVKGVVMGLASFVPATFRSSAERLDRQRPVLEWIAANTPAGAKMFSYSDPLVYLYTGRRGMSMRIPPVYFYTNDDSEIRQGVTEYFEGLDELIRRHGLTHLVRMESDYRLDLPEFARPELRRAILGRRMPEIYRDSQSEVYEIPAALPKPDPRAPPVQ